MTAISTPAPIVTTDSRAHRHQSCRRAKSFPDTTNVPAIVELAASTITACTYCKPSQALVDQAVSELQHVAAALSAPTADVYEGQDDGHDCDACGAPIAGEPVWDTTGPVIVALCAATCQGEGPDHTAEQTAEPVGDEDDQAIADALDGQDADPLAWEYEVPEGTVPTITVTPEAQAVVVQLADHLAAQRAEAVPTAAELMRADRARGLTIMELAAAHGVSATEARTAVMGVERGKPARADKPVKATTGPKATTEPKARRAPRKGLPEITTEDLDKLIAGHQAGKSFRALRDEFPHLGRAHSSLRAVILSELARRG